MAKRGETRPWRVTYEWDNGIKGSQSYQTEDHANLKADEIRRNAAHTDATVMVTVAHRDAKPMTRPANPWADIPTDQ